MASEVDICNLALSRIGESATVASIHPPEGSAQAEHCCRYYPLARDILLEAHDWHFATRRERLAMLNQGVFAVPSYVIRIIKVVNEQGKTVPFRQEVDTQSQRVIYANAQELALYYIAKINDPTSFSPSFIDALGWLLAGYLAGTIIKGTEGMRVAHGCATAYQTALTRAKVLDSNQQHIIQAHTPEWVQARS